jgi:hypothetical protein
MVLIGVKDDLKENEDMVELFIFTLKCIHK